jgi:hypothetical protein
MRAIPLTVAGALLSCQAVAAPVQVFYDNFDGGQAVASGVTAVWSYANNASIQGAQGYAGVTDGSSAFAGNILSSWGTNPSSGANKATLTLTGLSAHDSVNITGLLAVIDSWDSTDGGCCTPD